MKKIYKFVTSLLLVVVIALVAILFLPRVIGLQPLVVLSGSMEPAYHVGSLIYVMDVDPTTLEVDDPVTYRLSEDTMVTHRIVSIDSEVQTLKTKGDANAVEDGSEIPFTSVVGKPLFTIPLLGYLATYAATRTGMIIMITGILVVLILIFLPDLLLKADQEEDKKDGGVKNNEDK